jgi:hypothetical protein
VGRGASGVNHLKPSLSKNFARTAKKTLHRHKDQLVNAVNEIIAVYSENHTKHINTKS